MKAEKAKLTRIITLLNDKLPTEDDLWGYAGISKKVIIESLNQSYSFLGLLDDYENQMEVIWAKRRLAKIFEDINKLINKIGTEKWNEEFDNFLEKITKLRILVKDIYITLTDKPLRIDIDLQVAKEQFELLTEKSKGIGELIDLITVGSEKTNQHEIEIIKQEQILKNSIERAETTSNLNDKNNEELEKLIEKVKNVVPEIELHNKTAKEIKKEQDIAKEEAEKLLEQTKKADVELSRIIKEISQQIEKDGELQDSIKQTLEDVNKHGMAGSFLKRKKELRNTLVLWGTMSVLSIIIFIGLSYLIANEFLKASNIDPIRSLFKIPSVMASFFLCWFTIKQYGFTSRVLEDYSYKCAISMAFEGYKNETREVNEDLLNQLLQITIASIAFNPVMLYDSKTNHGSPWNEWIDGMKKLLRIDAKVDAKIEA